MNEWKSSNDLLLAVDDLKTWFEVDEGSLKAVDGLHLAVRRGEVLGIVGESGCGKSMVAYSILNIVPSPGRIAGGTISYWPSPDADPHLITEMDPHGKRIRAIRGKEIAMIFQEPMTSLSPFYSVGNQLMEVIRLHTGATKKDARERAIHMLKQVEIPDPEMFLRAYPHQLSGGMRQRVMIAIALSCNPSLLIADEPTTALDVTVQAQIMKLLQDLRREFDMGMIIITHDMGIIAENTDRVAVMYLGRIVETGSTTEIFENPLHPYTARLLKSVPHLDITPGEHLEVIPGSVPVPIDRPCQCGFYERCEHAMQGRCDRALPGLLQKPGGHGVACFLHHDVEDDHG